MNILTGANDYEELFIKWSRRKQMSVEETVDILLDFGGRKIINYCTKELRKGTQPYDIFNNLSIGLDEIGRKYETGRYFTSDLIVSGANMKKAIEILSKLFQKNSDSSKGKVLIGTVQGDVHDIGKTIFSIMLQSKGFEVVDLGVDVSNEEFIEKVEKKNPDILAISALLTSTMTNMEKVIESLKDKGLRERVKIIVGGRPINETYAKSIGADEYAEDAVEGVRKCLSLLNEVKGD
jgi:5-methyltetrahydrofolate--homocysteine methyltransferase